MFPRSWLRAPLLGALVLACPLSAGAETGMVLVLSPPELEPEKAEAMLQSAEEGLKTLSSLDVKPGKLAGPPNKPGCLKETACLAGIVRATGADQVLLINPLPEAAAVELEVMLLDKTGQAQRDSSDMGSFKRADSAVTAALQKVLPGWLRKGWGGVDVPAGATAVKVDGKLLPARPGVPAAAPAGRHELDVLSPAGSVLHLVQVKEGTRAQLPAAALPSASNSTLPRGAASPLRYVAYGAWTAGALGLAGAFVAGGLANFQLSSITACQGTSRTCTTFPEVQAAEGRAQSLNQAGNVMLAAGAGLAVAGAGLFTFDLLRP
jgi:hypothetical protein